MDDTILVWPAYLFPEQNYQAYPASLNSEPGRFSSFQSLKRASASSIFFSISFLSAPFRSKKMDGSCRKLWTKPVNFLISLTPLFSRYSENLLIINPYLFETNVCRFQGVISTRLREYGSRISAGNDGRILQE